MAGAQGPSTQVESSRRWLTKWVWGSRSWLDRREWSLKQRARKQVKGEMRTAGDTDEGQWHVNSGVPVLGLGGCPSH